MHTKRLNPLLTEQLLLLPIDVPQSNIHQFPGTNSRLTLHPTEDILRFTLRQTSQERHGHTVDIPTLAHLGSIDISMRIDPDNSHFATQPLTDSFGGTGDSPDSDGMVTTEGEDHLAILGVIVDLSAEFLCHGACSTRLLHASMVRVIDWGFVFVVVDGVVIVKFIAQIVTELVEEAGFD